MKFCLGFALILNIQYNVFHDTIPYNKNPTDSMEGQTLKPRTSLLIIML